MADKIYTLQELKNQLQKAWDAYDLPFENARGSGLFAPQPDT